MRQEYCNVSSQFLKVNNLVKIPILHPSCVSCSLGPLILIVGRRISKELFNPISLRSDQDSDLLKPILIGIRA